MDSEAKIVLVTGANTGLGYQIIRALCSSTNNNYQVLLAGRSLDKANKAVSDVVAEFPSASGRITSVQVDIESDESIEAAFEHVNANYGRLDALVNNAGAQFDPLAREGKMTMREMWNHSWNVNTTGTQIMTAVFVPLLLKSSDPRLLFITSGTSTLAGSENLSLPFNKVPTRGWPKNLAPNASIPAYRSVKTGLNMMMREWYRNLKEDGVKVWCVSPGYLATGLGGSQETNKSQGAADPSIGGEFVRDVLDGQRDDDVGKVILKDRVQPW